MILGGIPPLAPKPPLGAPLGGWGYPKVKNGDHFWIPHY